MLIPAYLCKRMTNLVNLLTRVTRGGSCCLMSSPASPFFWTGQVVNIPISPLCWQAKVTNNKHHAKFGEGSHRQPASVHHCWSCRGGGGGGGNPLDSELLVKGMVGEVKLLGGD